jgi:hypothetical protein
MKNLSLHQMLLIAGTIVLVCAALPLRHSSVSAQEIQPTGQAAPVTQNPQLLPPANLGAPTANLQGSGGPQTLGASLNQTTGQVQNIRVPQSSAAPSGSGTPPVTARQTDGQGLPFSTAIVAAGLLMVIFGIMAAIIVKNRRAYASE